MDNNTLVSTLREKFSRIPFFVRVFMHNGKLVIWNDHDIKLILTPSEVKDQNLDNFVTSVKEKITIKIKEKYKNFKNRMISVVIPNYNNEIYIKKTIDSILNSNYKNLEVIFIDDCSTDRSVEIVRKNYGNDPRVRIYENKTNGGAYYNRNKGILLSKGYYVTFVDGDDFIHPNKLKYDMTNLELSNKKVGRTKYWAFGSPFVRLYIENNDINNILRQKTAYSVTYVFYRKLFNWVGFYCDNRFGCDTEIWKRSESFGYYFASNRNPNRAMYYAYTQEGKNLTRTISEGQRWKWMHERERIFKSRGYIEMALLDKVADFVELIGLKV